MMMMMNTHLLNYFKKGKRNILIGILSKIYLATQSLFRKVQERLGELLLVVSVKEEFAVGALRFITAIMIQIHLQ